jgi:hypothetical protein
MELVGQLCSPLCGVYEMEDGIFEIDLIHHTTAQFIHQCAKKEGSEVPEILKPQALKELYRGKISAWFSEKKSDVNIESATHTLTVIRWVRRVLRDGIRFMECFLPENTTRLLGRSRKYLLLANYVTGWQASCSQKNA